MADVYEVRDPVRGESSRSSGYARCDDPERRQAQPRAVRARVPRARAARASARRRGLRLRHRGQPALLHDGAAGRRRSARARAASPWQRACAIARDVCSVLSLLHSRRLVYRDLSPRNVRCTQRRPGQADRLRRDAADGADAGRWSARRRSARPRRVQLQALDARTDLYSLGATLYYVLVGRHAYPARDFRAAARAVAAAAAAAARAVGAGMPEALDALVMELLQPRPRAAPGQRGRGDGAADRDRAACPTDEQLLGVAGVPDHADPGRPRRASSRGVRKKVAQAQQRPRRRAAGARRVRQRPLALARRVRARGQAARARRVLRADAIDGQRATTASCARSARSCSSAAGSWRLRLLRRICRCSATWCRRCSRRGPTPTLQNFADPNALRPALQARAARSGSLAVAAAAAGRCSWSTTFDRIDEPSAAFLALLAHEAPRCSLLVCASVARGRRHALVGAAAARRGEREGLARRAQRRADRACCCARCSATSRTCSCCRCACTRLAEGNPRDVLQLAQHLVDKGVAALPRGRLDACRRASTRASCPSSMAQALDARVAALRAAAARAGAGHGARARPAPDAARSARCCSSESEHGKVLSGARRAAARRGRQARGAALRIAQEGLIAALRRTLERRARGAAAARARGVFESRGDRLRGAMALIHSGDEQRGLDALVQAVGAVSDRHRQRHRGLQPARAHAARRLVQWFDTAIALCAKHGRSARDVFVLKKRQTSLLSSLTGMMVAPPYAAFLARARAPCRARHRSAARSGAAAAKRGSRRCSSWRRRATTSCPSTSAAIDPRSALGQLARTIVNACGTVSVGHDHALLRAIPSLAPFVGALAAARGGRAAGDLGAHAADLAHRRRARRLPVAARSAGAAGRRRARRVVPQAHAARACCARSR